MKLLSNINASKWATRIEKNIGRGLIYIIFCKISSFLCSSEVISTLSIEEGYPEDENTDIYFDISCISLLIVPKEEYCCDMMLYNRWVNGHDIVLYSPPDDEEMKMKTYSRVSLLIGWLFSDTDVSQAIMRAKLIHPSLYLDSKSQLKVQEKLENFNFLYNSHYPLLHHKLIHPYIFKVSKIL